MRLRETFALGGTIYRLKEKLVKLEYSFYFQKDQHQTRCNNNSVTFCRPRPLINMTVK